MFYSYDEFRITDLVAWSNPSFDRAKSILRAIKAKGIQTQIDALALIPQQQIQSLLGCPMHNQSLCFDDRESTGNVAS